MSALIDNSHSIGTVSSSTATTPAASANNAIPSPTSSTSTPYTASEVSHSQTSPPSEEPASGASFRNPHDKKGRSTSCLLCQKRKQKCDHRLPSCTTCIKAGVKCIQPAKYAVKAPDKDEYTIMLEKKVKFLEKILDANNIVIDQEGNTTKKNFKYKKLSPFLSNESTTAAGGPGMAPQILAPNTLPAVGNKIIPIPTNRKLPMISEDLQNKKNYLSIDSADYTNSLLSKYNLKDFLDNYDPVFEFDEKLSRAFLDIHFTRVQFKYPLLDEQEIFEFHNAYVTNNLAGYMNNNDHFHFCCSRMWMIFAISSCLHMSTGKYSGPPPARYFSTAIRHISKCKSLTDLQKVEILTLAVLYLIRTDRDSVCLYDIIKDSMSICVSLGLNRSITYSQLDPKDCMKKVRLWWCVYLLERMISIAVGRSYTFPENAVDSDIPLFKSDQKTKQANSATFINQSIKLRRIESRFVEELNIHASIDCRQVDQNQLPKVEKYFQELEIWRANCDGFANEIENETLRLYYYRSVRLLIQPFLEHLDPMDRLFRECQAAAGHICQLFKVFHEKTVFGHSTTAIHTVFVAGVTLIYCLWLARNKDDMKRKALGDVSKHTRPTVSESLFSGLNDLRACSVCLYVMSERSKFAFIFRDTFDQLMSATIGNLIERCGPDSSELIYNDEPGMPPAIVRRAHYGRVSGLLNSNQTAEEKLEQAERRRKQGQLQKNVVPKSLSHLLINSPPVGPVDDQPPLKRAKCDDYHFTAHNHQQPTITNPSSKPHSSVSNDFSLNFPQYPGTTNSASTTSSSSNSSSHVPGLQQPGSSANTASSVSTPSSFPTSTATIPPELTPFNGRTSTMINNISFWTGESGGVPITSSLFDHSNYTTSGLSSKGINPEQTGSGARGNGKGPDSNYLWNVPVEEFWTNNDDYGFLA